MLWPIGLFEHALYLIIELKSTKYMKSIYDRFIGNWV